MGNHCSTDESFYCTTTGDTILSEQAKLRMLVLPDETEEPEISLPEYKCLIENYKEVGGINSVLEDAIFFYANLVERRSSAVARLEGICYQPKNDLQDCYNRHQDCSLKCSDEVEAFTACVSKQYPLVVNGKIRSKIFDKKRAKREQDLLKKYNI